MAMDVILPFEEISERVVSFNDLLDARTVSSILEAFDNKLGKSCCSKIKYVGQFSKFLKFLLFDVGSPESNDNETDTQLLSKDI